MSQDFLGAFPAQLKPEVLQQKNDEEFRKYTKEFYDNCLKKIGERKFPCTVYLPSSSQLRNGDSTKAENMVISKLSDNGYNAKMKSYQSGMNDYECVLIIELK